MNANPLRVVVTGAAGFIGSAVVRRLVLEVGADVVSFDALTYAGRLSSLRDVIEHPRHRFIRGDVCDAAALETLLREFRPQQIMHLAAESHVDRSISGSAPFIRTNIIGVYTLLEEARRYWGALDARAAEGFRLLHVSTDEVYGSLGPHGAFSETNPYDPSSPYSASKAAADHLAMAWSRTYGLPVLISNCSNNYGPYHFPEKLIPLAILNALEGRPIPIYGTGQNVRDWLHVEDHARALCLIAEKGAIGRKYNVGGGAERTNLAVVETICAILDDLRVERRPHAALMQFVEDRPGHDLRYAIDSSRLRDELGWRPLYDFDLGLRQTVEWYLSNAWWWSPLRV